MNSDKLYKIIDIMKYCISQANTDNLTLKLYRNYHNCTILIEYDVYGLFGLGEKKKRLYSTFIDIFLPNYLFNDGLKDYFEIEKRRDNAYILKLKKLDIKVIDILITLYKLRGIIK